MNETLPESSDYKPHGRAEDSGAAFLKFIRNGAILFILAVAVMATVHFYRLLAQWETP